MSRVEPVTPELLAATLVVPSATAIATPLPVTVATLGCDADHVTLPLRFTLDPSLMWPVAENGSDEPGAIVLSAGITTIFCSVGGELPPPPHSVPATKAQRQERSKTEVRWSTEILPRTGQPKSISLAQLCGNHGWVAQLA